MACKEDFYTGEDLEAILEAIYDDVWDKDDDFNEEIDTLIQEIEEEPPKSGFKCKKCKKCERVCKSKQGLSRHQNSKHREHKPDQEEVVKKKSKCRGSFTSTLL